MLLSDIETITHLPKKTPLFSAAHADALVALQRAAVTMRRKILYLGYANRIKLHYPALLSMTEIVTTLYMHWLNIDPARPDWAERDRFTLSKGHGAPAVYVALWMAGFFDEKHFDGFRRLNSILQGHPDRVKTPGIDTSSGSLGQAFPVACGMALGAHVDRSMYRVYSLLGDGECNEGSIWEAAMIAANLQLDRITAIVDRNHKSSYGWMTDRNEISPLAEKWQAFNWAVFECDGHDFASLTQALSKAEAVEGQPSVIIAHTIKGKGLPITERPDTPAHIALSPEDYGACLDYLDEVEKGLGHGSRA
jgi:transketolase